jgi:hypothetical protein
MSNVITVPHTVEFIATIDLDKIDSNLLPALLSLSEDDLTKMCAEATHSALDIADVLTVANTGYSWAELSIKKGN